MDFKKFRLKAVLFFSFIFAFCVYAVSYASDGGNATHSIFVSLLAISLILLFAKFSGMVERVGQPSVLGELVMGILLGNLYLVGINFFEGVKTDEIIKFLSELGVIILLFQIGLESNIEQMKKVGFRALLVAIVGVVVPFVLGTYIIGPWLLPGLSSIAYLFLGASLTATSVGITARVFKDLNYLHSKEAQIVLGAAVIDDVLGLVILAVVSAIATTGTISTSVISIIILKAVLFLFGSILLGHFSAPYIGKYLSKIHTGIGMKFTLAISFGLIFSAIAGSVGLAPIVGAFAAGLVLDAVHFKGFKEPEVVKEIKEVASDLPQEKLNKINHIIDKYSKKHIEELIEPLGFFFVPVFFIMTGMSVDLKTFVDPNVLLIALGVTVTAFIGKIVAGFVAGNCRKILVGWAMVPRGEVGLIFATIGKGLGVIDDRLFSIVVIMVILSTLVTPLVLAKLLQGRTS